MRHNRLRRAAVSALKLLPLSQFKWFRRLHGGKWMETYVDHPVCDVVWVKVPDDASDDYREPLWRGTPQVENWSQ